MLNKAFKIYEFLQIIGSLGCVRFLSMSQQPCFFQDACLKGKNIWHQHLPTKKLTAYLIASFHSIKHIFERKIFRRCCAIIDQNNLLKVRYL